MADCFFVQEAADRFVATELTRGPWDAGAQHGGPPAALAGHVAEIARDGMQVTRFTAEILRPVPIAALGVTTRTVHEGRSVQVVEVVLAPDGGRPVLRATAQLIRTSGASPDAQPQLPGPDAATEHPFEFRFDIGYHTAMQARFVSGAFGEPGPATCWMRMRVPLIDGEPTSPLSRVLAAADSGNGISNVLDISRYVFINPDLSVHLHRYPAGEWVCLDARTTLGAGIAVADTALHDEHGPIGRGVQSLFVGERQ